MLKLSKREIAGLFAAAVYSAILMCGYYVVTEQVNAAATWERKYNEAKETEQRAFELLWEKNREFDAYKAQVELDKRIEESSRAQAMANYEALGDYRYIGECRITHYCPCEECCGQWADGVTASGLKLEPGMVAVDPDVIPLGSTVIINGIPYLAADTGVTGCAIDIAVLTHGEADELGTYQAEVWVIVNK